MPLPATLSPFLESFKTRTLFADLYGRDPAVIQAQIKRYQRIARAFNSLFPKGDIQWFSTPGRTELGGNHTDHNAGCVLAASVNLDSVAAVVKTNDAVIQIKSEGFPALFTVDVRDCAVKPAEKGTTTALVRGIVSRFKELGFCVGGFNAYIASNVLVGSGLSSSASFEVLLGTIVNTLYNGNRMKAEAIAMVGCYAENVYFGKPCGLMDQMACAVGGIISIDFKDAKKPVVKKVRFDFSRQKYRLLVVDTGGNHTDLTEDYTSVPAEMKSVAACFSKKVCREISYNELASGIEALRTSVGDRAILRALHFLEENDRVALQVKALLKNDFLEFLNLVTASGDSSFKWCQNCYTTKNPREQGVSIALAFTRRYLDKIKQGACRVHGGGFAGTIQVFIPQKHVEAYRALMEAIFKRKSVLTLNIRPYGSVCLTAMHQNDSAR
jgi:galactokinase